VHPDTIDLIGWFATNSLVGVDVGSATNVSELLRRAQDALLIASNYGEVPLFELQRLVAAKGASKNEGRSVPTGLSVPNAAVTCHTLLESDLLSLSRLSVQKCALPFLHTGSPFTLSFVQAQTGGIRLRLTYRAALLNATMADKMLESLKRILVRFIAVHERQDEITNLIEDERKVWKAIYG